MLAIEINNKPYNLLQKLPDKITQANIIWNTKVKMVVNKETAGKVEYWCKEIVHKLDCNYIGVNGILTSVKDLQDSLKS